MLHLNDMSSESHHPDLEASGGVGHDDADTCGVAGLEGQGGSGDRLAVVVEHLSANGGADRRGEDMDGRGNRHEERERNRNHHAVESHERARTLRRAAVDPSLKVSRHDETGGAQE